MLYDKLKSYALNGAYPFHMPGHKRIDVTGEGVIPYSLDITEINGFDNLHNPGGCLKSLEDKAAKIYNAQKAFLLVNGATGGILSAIRAMTKPGDRVLVARNCHISVYNAVELCGLKPIYYVPDEIDCSHYNIFGSISKNYLEFYFQDYPDIKLAILTSPTYDGVISDIKGIAEVCHKNNVKLLVDEAHGAHLPFMENMPKGAVECGADVSVVSLHKTLPALTQTALLLCGNEDLEKKLRYNLSVFQTSSPSYLLMSSIDVCLDYISKHKNDFSSYSERLERFSEQVKILKNIKVMFRDRTENLMNLYAYDYGKLFISTTNADISGSELADKLRDCYGIEIEMHGPDFVLVMTSVCDTNEAFDKLADALIKIDSQCKAITKNALYYPDWMPKRNFYACKKHREVPELVKFDNSDKRTSLEYIIAYPPGIPLIVPGEIIDADIISSVHLLINNGIEIYSSEKNLPDYITVAEI